MRKNISNNKSQHEIEWAIHEYNRLREKREEFEGLRWWLIIGFGILFFLGIYNTFFALIAGLIGGFLAGQHIALYGPSYKEEKKWKEKIERDYLEIMSKSNLQGKDDLPSITRK